MQLSVFYQFARNHYNLTDYGKELHPPQEPYNLEDGYKDAATRAIFERYSFLRYSYTRLFEISKWGGTFIRPSVVLWVPVQQRRLSGIRKLFYDLICTKSNASNDFCKRNKGNVSSFFPAKLRFVSLNYFKTIVNGDDNGLNSTFEESLNYTIVHMRDGSVIPYQNMTDELQSSLAIEEYYWLYFQISLELLQILCTSTRTKITTTTGRSSTTNKYKISYPIQNGVWVRFRGSRGGLKGGFQGG